MAFDKGELKQLKSVMLGTMEPFMRVINNNFIDLGRKIDGVVVEIKIINKRIEKIEKQIGIILVRLENLENHELERKFHQLSLENKKLAERIHELELKIQIS